MDIDVEHKEKKLRLKCELAIDLAHRIVLSYFGSPQPEEDEPYKQICFKVILEKLLKE